MRWALRIVGALALIVLLAFAALALLLPRLVESEAVRARLQSAAEAALGREVRWGELELGLLPPSLLLMEPVVAGAAAGDPPFLEAERVALRVALLPLLARAVVVDSLVVEGATLRLARGPQGLELPGPAGGGEPAPPADSEPQAGAGVDLAVRRASLRGATVVLEDRAVSPAVVWELREVRADLRGSSLAEPLDFDASAELASGGAFSAEGQAGLDGRVEARARLDALALAPLRPYLGPELSAGGRISGSAVISGPAAAPESLDLELAWAGAELQSGDLRLGGELSLAAQLSGALADPAGRFSLDATRAEIRQAESFVKPEGVPARVSGRLAEAPGSALRIEDLRLELRNLVGSGSLSLAERSRLQMHFEPFELKGWGELLPALAPYQPEGPLDLGEIDVRTAPLALRADVDLGGVRARYPEAGPVQLRGGLVASGDTLKSRDLALVAAEQTVHLDVTVSELGGVPSYQLATRTEQADTNRLVSSFTAQRDTFFGLLDLDGDLRGRVDADPLRALRGQTRLDIRDGRIAGLSLLQSIFAGMSKEIQAAGVLGAVALDLAGLRSPELQRFYAEDIEELAGTFRFRDGVASTDDLRIRYADYGLQLDGTFGMQDGTYDLGSELTLGPQLAAALARSIGGGVEPDGRIVLPARLAGSLAQPFQQGRNPRVTVERAAAVAFARTFASGRYRPEAERAIDEKLGTGAGKQILDAFEGILGGRPPAPGSPPPPTSPRQP